MALFSWESRYTVGIARWDRQHQRLFELLNKLHDGMRAGYGRTVLLRILEELFEYTNQHFVEEERAMHFFSYPSAAAHQAQHDTLRAQVSQFLKECQEGAGRIRVEIVNFGVRWLTHHILNIDREYRDFFSERDLASMYEIDMNRQAAAPIRELDHGISRPSL